MARRIVARAMGRPLEGGEDSKIRWPTNIERIKYEKGTPHGGKPGCTVEFEDREWAEPVTAEQIAKRFKLIMDRKLSSGEDNFKMVVKPNDSISANGIRAKIREWDREGWSPDVVVVDYADILAPSSKTQEARESINNTWKRLRAISQEFHCLLLTATQADAASYTAPLIRRSNFSDDKRKYAHVTGTFAINQTEDERKMDVTRVNWIVLREQEMSEKRVFYAAGCRACNAIAIRSA
jgi:hypothetical protein